MNGAERKIEIFAPFGEAYERMKKILFRPFDISKWFVIGFAAFISGHFGSGGFSPPFPGGRFKSSQFSHQNVPTMPTPSHLEPWAVVAIVALVLCIFAIIVVLSWVIARGRFVFTDCIVQNRAAIAQPWREFRKEGNSYFIFVMAVTFGGMMLMAVIALAIFLPLSLLGGAGHGVSTPVAVIFFALVCIIWICFAIYFGVVIHFMIPIMYIRRCKALEAFREVHRLIMQNIAPFVLFCLFGIVLVMAMVIVSGIVSCLTCCIAALPYIGTVILLPIFVWLYAFGFCFLRQFGPQYDVWTKVTQPEVPPATSTSPPPLPT
jgi:MFS family permease